MTNDPIPVPVPSFPPPPPSKLDGKTQAIAFSLFGVALLALVGLVTKSWFTIPGGGVGLTGVEACRGSRCMTMSWGDIPHVPSDITLWAYVGLIGGLAAVGVAGAMGGMLLANKAHKIPVKAFNIVLGIAAFGTTMFLMRLYSDDPKHATFGWSGFVAIGAIIAIGALTKQGVMPRATARA
ncbi:MAG TPA: hypothetical protein VL463_02010 [Kofleriaceae bacterium]|jgi:hypothetical protein|nr:hypothetical protein [Kofleriaceae bacterium]